MRKLVGNLFHFQSLKQRIDPICKFSNILTDSIKNHNKYTKKRKYPVAENMRLFTGRVVSEVFFGNDFIETKIEGKLMTSNPKML